MAKSTIASLEARIIALETELAALRAQNSAPRPRRWEPSQSAQQLKAEYLKRTAAGERVKIQSGAVVAY